MEASPPSRALVFASPRSRLARPVVTLAVLLVATSAARTIVAHASPQYSGLLRPGQSITMLSIPHSVLVVPSESGLKARPRGPASTSDAFGVAECDGLLAIQDYARKRFLGMELDGRATWVEGTTCPTGDAARKVRFSVLQVGTREVALYNRQARRFLSVRSPVEVGASPVVSSPANDAITPALPGDWKWERLTIDPRP